MTYLIAPGVALTLAGLIGLIWCILQVVKAKRAGLDDDALKARLQSIVIYNMGALLLSAIGLMMVVVGMLL